MKTNRICILLFASCLVFACTKKETKQNIVPPPHFYQPFTASLFFNNYGNTPKVFHFHTSELPLSFTLRGGGSIAVPAAAFTQNKQLVSGDVSLSVTQYYQKNEMILSGIHTMANGQILESSGSLLIEATINGSSVDGHLATGKEFEITMNAANTSKGYTQLFAGVVEMENATEKQLNWKLFDENPLKAINNQFIFNWGKMGLINCDVFYNYPASKTTYTVLLPNNPGVLADFLVQQKGETFVFFVPRGINSVVQLYNHTHQFSVKSYDNSLPIGMDGKLLAFCIMQGNCWYAEKEIRIQNNGLETLQLIPSHSDTIQAKINLLAGY